MRFPQHKAGEMQPELLGSRSVSSRSGSRCVSGRSRSFYSRSRSGRSSGFFFFTASGQGSSSDQGGQND